ncbi:hypothetical protein AX27061_5609 [Achromobacter xylosoxidans NBRC 15126 = ATCC 27061]|nr:hypothetical protein AX27061_5609 [Achromobacter xylosoxidans NBRC 15126 = ATCC 27061]
MSRRTTTARVRARRGASERSARLPRWPAPLTAILGSTAQARPAATISFMASVLPSSMTGLTATPASSNQSSTRRRVRAPGSNSTSGNAANACGVTASGIASGPRAGKMATNSSSSTGVASIMRPGAGRVTRPMSNVLFSSPRSMSAVLPVLATTSSAGKRRRRSASRGGSR